MRIKEFIGTEINNRIQSIDSNYTPENISSIASVINLLSTDRSNVIEYLSYLPSAQDFPEGSIFFINELNTLVYSSEGAWKGLDGRIFRQDTVSQIYSWGCNIRGQLGDESTVNKSSPVSIPTIAFWSQISTGYGSHIVALTQNGNIYTWGSNATGQLGDNSTISRSSPVAIVGGIPDWNQVSAGEQHCIALTKTGKLYAWGNNDLGRLGDGFTSRKSSPVLVLGGTLGWSQISAGGGSSFGIANGVLYSWGCCTWGQLGDNTQVAKSSPITVVGGITNWSQVSAGRFHALGLTETGIAYAWGCGIRGQLGNDLAVRASSPVTVVGGITNWSQVSAGAEHSLGIANGIAYSWGNSSFGRLGDGTTIVRSSPVTVVGGITNWSQVSAGGLVSAGIADGIAYVWGWNAGGALGDNTTTSKSSPVAVVGGITNWTNIIAGTVSSHAIRTE